MGGVSNASLKNRIRANLMDRKAWRVNELKPKPWTIPLKPLRKVGQGIYNSPELRVQSPEEILFFALSSRPSAGVP